MGSCAPMPGVRGGPQRGSGTTTCVPMDDSGAKDGTHTVFCDRGIVGIPRVEHGDDRSGADAVEPGPLTLGETELHGLPIVGVAASGLVQQSGGLEVTVDQAEERAELLEVDSHLVDKVAHGHLLGCGQPIEVPTVRLGIVDGLDG